MLAEIIRLLRNDVLQLQRVQDRSQLIHQFPDPRKIQHLLDYTRPVAFLRRSLRKYGLRGKHRPDLRWRLAFPCSLLHDLLRTLIPLIYRCPIPVFLIVDVLVLL
ncbi:hypothetical protein PDUR_04240 [Paenibacillus durus]|uniref:Uncharacterized protein n=1 Tax=Paenibacillus durus TaxID=44251 RepID=A0A089IQG2_PAEDU|nr:hypothetical protein PDUR_04240 [Paenibacillus durus]